MISYVISFCYNTELLYAAYSMPISFTRIKKFPVDISVAVARLEYQLDPKFKHGFCVGDFPTYMLCLKIE